MYKKLTNNDLGIDLGTSSIKIAVGGKGVLIKESSCVVKDMNHKHIAYGNLAGQMCGKLPEELVFSTPIKSGVIFDYDNTVSLLKRILYRLYKSSTTGFRSVVSFHSHATNVEKRALEEAIRECGGKAVYITPSAEADAVGLGFNDDNYRIIVNLGGGCIEASLLRGNTLVKSNSLKYGVNVFDDAIIKYLKEKYGVLVGVQTARYIKEHLASAIPDMMATLQHVEPSLEISGCDPISGVPKYFKISHREVYASIESALTNIVVFLKGFLSSLRSDEVHQALNYPVYLTGGGSKIYFIKEFMESRLSIDFKVANKPIFLSSIGCLNTIGMPTKLKKISRHLDRWEYRG